MIGGGVVGIGAALALAAWGVSVVLLEKGRIAAEQSSRNWGWIRAQGRDPREVPLMLASADLWRAAAARAGEDFGFGVRGCTYLAESEAELARRAAWLKTARAHQIDSRILSSAEVDRLLRRSDRRFVGALHTPSDASAEPTLAVQALARLAGREGVLLFEGTAVRALERAGGRVTGVVTEHGRIGAQAVILAGGAWSRTLLENEGLSLPQLAVRASALRTMPAPEITAGAVGATGASFRRRSDGGYTIARAGSIQFDLVPAAFTHLRAFLPLMRSQLRGVKLRVGRGYFGPLGRQRWAPDEVSPFERVRVLDPVPDERLLAEVMQTAKILFPQMARARPAASWAGMIDVTPDEVPVIDAVAGLPGLTVATGMSGHGFGLGLGAGRLAAELATGRAPIVDPRPFALARFKGGVA